VSTLSRHYLSTVAANASILLLGVLSGVLAARLLGPEARGELAVIILWPSAVVYILGSLGLHDAATYFAARHPERLNAVFTVLQVLGLAQTVVFGALAYFLLPWVLAGHRPEVIALTRLFLLFLPAGFNSLYLLKLLQGRMLLRQYNLARVFVAAWYAALLVALYFLGRVSLPWIVGGQLVGYGLAALLHYYFVRAGVGPVWEWDPSVIRPLLRYGVQAQFSIASAQLNFRLDQLVMSIWLPPAALGTYVVAVTLTSPLRALPLAIGTVTLPAAARESPAAARGVIGQSLRTVGLLLVGSAAALYWLVPYLLPLFFGEAFAPAIAACRVLVVASVPLGFSLVLYDGLRALNKPQVPGYAELVGNGVTAALLAVLLPRYGILGAAYASLGAYTASLLFQLWYIHRRLRLSVRELLLARRAAAEPAVLRSPAPEGDEPPAA